MEILIDRLWNLAASMNAGEPPGLGDDACIYAGSATWEVWQNHVPLALVESWPLLSEEARLAAYLTAKAFTHYKAGIM